MVIKTEICLFSGLKIYPGHGIRYVPCSNVQTTRPVFTFVTSKSLSLFLRRRNPRVIRWTQLYRRQHKKGSIEQLKKNKKRRVVKVERGVAGASVEFIKAQKNQTQEQRTKIREASKQPKTEKKEKKAVKKTDEQKQKQKEQQRLMKSQMKTTTKKNTPKIK
ncbi:hypothetical protein ABK040_005510 [Willaertia magna]